MQNRIRHLLNNWHPELPASEPEAQPQPETSPEGGYAMPRGINMLMPVELCINRDLLMSLLSASIREIQRHKRALPEGYSTRELAEVEAALQQQLTFRAWIRNHPGHFISVAMYPVTETGSIDQVEDLDLGEF
jgi:hypothetical protein